MAAHSSRSSCWVCCVLALVFAWLPLAAVAQTTEPATKPATARPNIIVILSDDMGYSDVGSFGGEIQTPNLDRLASDGLRFTQFYNAGRCCPTRASLLTGLYPHQAGIGHMVDSPRELPGYQADLSRSAATIAQVLRPAGYRSYAIGKWHVSRNQKDPQGDLHNWPLQRGFDDFYGIITGAADFFDPGTLCRQNTLITPTSDTSYQPATYYFTDAISDYTTRFIRDHHEKTPDQPFFAYVAYTAAHWPMHAKPDDIAKYAGQYDAGYEAIRAARFERMKSLGIISADTTLTPLDAKWPADPSLQKWNAQCMEVYAAMVDSMDQGIGRIVETLRETGQLDNTLIIYLQDNGACAELIGREREGVSFGPDAPRDPLTPSTTISTKSLRDGRPVRVGPRVVPGGQDTYIAYGRGWANVSNTPFREYKHDTHEGGIATPLIVHWPAGFQAKNQLRHEPGHLIDIMATCVDVSGATYPNTIDGHAILPAEGRSLRPAFEDRPIERDMLFWEHEGNRALRMGKFKLVAKGDQSRWELYDMETDRVEMNDLSAALPEQRRKMIERWTLEANRTLTLPWPWKPRNDE